MDQFLKNALPAWLSNPDLMLAWVMANQVMLGLLGGLFLFVYIGACLFLRRMYLRMKKPKEFGKAIWADQGKLREQGLIRKDL
jgi:hypothetical protein